MGPDAASSDTGPAHPTPLLDRAAELAAIGRAVDRCVHGDAALLVIEGPTGIGKSRLIEAVRDAGATAGARPLSARASELERAFSFGVALQLVEPALAKRDAAEREHLLRGAAGHVLPVLEGRHGDLEGHAASVFPLLHGFWWLLANLAEEAPLALLVDDIHLADEASLMALNYVAQRFDGTRLLIAAASRTDDPGPRSSSLRTLLGHPRADTLRPGPLDPNSIAGILSTRLGRIPDASFARACGHVTGGNPLFISELAGEIERRGIETTREAAVLVTEISPPAIGQLVSARFAALSPAARALAEAVAILGDGAPSDLGGALAHLDAHEVAAATDELTIACILQSSRPEFVHPIVRRAVQAGLTPRRRAELHLKAARLLRERNAGAARVALHLLSADPAGESWATRCLRTAARQAFAAGSPQTAEAYLRRLLEEPLPDSQRVGVLIELGRVMATGGAPTGAADVLEEALELADVPVDSARVQAELGSLFASTGRAGEAAAAYEAALGTLGSDDPALERQLEARFVAAARLTHQLQPEAVSRLRTLSSRPQPRGAERAVLAQLAVEASLSSSPKRAIELATRTLRDGLPGPANTPETSTTLAAAVCALLFADAPERAENVLLHALEVSRRNGSELGYATASNLLGATRWSLGRIRSAIADLTATEELGREVGMLTLPTAHAVRAFCAIEQDDLLGAAAALELPGGDAEWEATVAYDWVLHARARVALAEGDPEAAFELLMLAGDRQQRVPVRNPLVMPWRSDAGLAAHAHGHADGETDALIAAELSLARECELPRAIARSLRAQALVGPAGLRVPRLEEAARLLERSHALLERAGLLVDLGTALRRSSQRIAARDALRRGLDLAFRCGATVLMHRATEELTASGARPRRAAARGLDALTPSELRVAELAADGLTNRQIAQTIFVTPKTVEFHLRNVFLKLGVHGRGELPLLFAGRGRTTDPQAADELEEVG